LKKLTTKPKTDPIPAGQGDELTKKKKKILLNNIYHLHEEKNNNYLLYFLLITKSFIELPPSSIY